MGIKGLLGEISAGGELGTAVRIVMLGRSSVYIEGIKGIDCYSPCLVRLRAGGGHIAVHGEALTIRELSRGEITLSGAITSIENLY